MTRSTLILINLTAVLMGIVSIVIAWAWCTAPDPGRYIGTALGGFAILTGGFETVVVLRHGRRRRVPTLPTGQGGASRPGHFSSSRPYLELPKVSGRPGAGAAAPAGQTYGTLATATDPGATWIELCAAYGAAPAGSIIEIGMGDTAETRITGEPILRMPHRRGHEAIFFAAGMPPLRNNHSLGEVVTIRARLAPVRPFEPDFDCLSYPSPRTKETAIRKHIADRAVAIGIVDKAWPAWVRRSGYTLNTSFELGTVDAPPVGGSPVSPPSDSVRSFVEAPEEPLPRKFELFGKCPRCPEVDMHLLGDRDTTAISTASSTVGPSIDRECRACGHTWKERLDA